MGMLGQPRDSRQKNLSYQHALVAELMRGASRPQRCADLTDGGGTLVERVLTIQPQELDTSPPEAGVGKKQRAE